LSARGKIKPGGSDQKGDVKFPLFLFGFLGMVILNSNGFFTAKAIASIEKFDMFLLTMAMEAMGLETDFKRLLHIGYKPLVLSILSTCTISIVSLGLIYLLY